MAFASQCPGIAFEYAANDACSIIHDMGYLPRASFFFCDVTHSVQTTGQLKTAIPAMKVFPAGKKDSQ